MRGHLYDDRRMRGHLYERSMRGHLYDERTPV